jgi:histidinol dehydrogenase
MRVTRNTPASTQPALDLAEPVREIIEEVRAGGDAAVLTLTERFDHAELGPDGLRVEANELEASVGVLEPDVVAGLRTAIANVKAVAKAQVRDEAVTVELPEGHSVQIAERPVRRAGDCGACVWNRVGAAR